MTEEKLKACKEDLLTTYKDVLCDESNDDIRAANNAMCLVCLLHKFATFLRYKVIPSADWARKWFEDEKDLLNQCGVYLDQVAVLINPAETSIVLMGNSEVTLLVNQPDLYNVTLQDASTLHISAADVTSVTVREKGTGTTNIISQGIHSKIKIHKI